ncbi:MAG: DUF5691 domain-containing protein, partial [Actinomycetota bacterium]|nr:DUF5691 domain-containing protein [Actinomycetota bacterium]
GGPELWEHGDRVERRAFFAELRRAAPQQARELLAGSWKSESGEDREAFLDALVPGLSAEDEPLLEAALDDRRKAVRERAAVLLVRLPDSAFARRMSGRARAAVRLERRLLRSRLVVEPPAELDASMVRDGISAKAPAGTGPQAWWLRQILAGTPLAVWGDLLGSPAGATAIPVDGTWRDVLLAGWIDATLRQRDREWARALLATNAADVQLPALVGLLEPGERAALVAGAVAGGATVPQQVLTALLEACPAPWPRPLVDAVLSRLAKPPGHPQDWLMREQLSVVAHRLPPEAAAAVSAVAGQHPPDSPWAPALIRVAETLSFRRHMLEELR